jgi:16S rRNA (guanine966-N2)-methyltransferase
MSRSSVRIIGGNWRRRLLHFPDVPDLRPTPDRVRETLFNWLGQDLDGRACLDLFAGSGALGMEAASRNAARVVMVEQDRRACRAIEQNVSALGATAVHVRCEDAFAFLASDQSLFDVVFLDPPYRLNLLPRLLQALPAHMKPGAHVYLEAQRPPEIPEAFEVVRRSRAGQVQYLLLQSVGNENPIQ